MFIHMSSANARDSVETTGDILAISIPAIGLASTLLYEDGYEGSIQFLKSFATSQVTTELLKLATHKERPNGSCCKSFPSGHTSAAFMGASFIHERYGLEYGIPAYIAAAYVGHTRVHAKKHYTVDVLAGAAVGMLSSFYFTEPYKGFDVSPSITSDAFEIRISKTW
jgi:membrane-associated phospholipid phosphatase